MYIKVVVPAHLYFFDEIINCNYLIYLKNTDIFKILKLNVKTTYLKTSILFEHSFYVKLKIINNFYSNIAYT